LSTTGIALTVQQWDTFLNSVAPLYRNRLTREWFHSGRAKYVVAGQGADDFTGTLEVWEVHRASPRPRVE
jgi:MspA